MVWNKGETGKWVAEINQVPTAIDRMAAIADPASESGRKVQTYKRLKAMAVEMIEKNPDKKHIAVIVKTIETTDADIRIGYEID